ncbi:MAG: hypothetical protein DRO46_02770 [Candidatus Hecatellales archaeon]|nr:MAG: hypothetical protein DRO46_02770 [Candidatus Hecatellales archaeon]
MSREGRLFTLCLTIFSVMLGFGIIAPLLPLYAESMGATGFEIGLVFSAFALVRVATTTPMGALSDIYGRKRFLVLGIPLYIASSLLYLAAFNVPQLIAIRVFHGFASALVVPAALAYVADLYPSSRRGEAMGSFNTAYFAGVGFGPLLGGLLADLAGFNWPFYACALLALAGFLLSLLKLKETRIEHSGRKMKISYGFKLLSNRRMVSLISSRVTWSIAMSSLLAFFPLLSLQAGLGLTETGFLLTFSMAVTISLQRRFGRLSDKYGRKFPMVAGYLLAGLSLILIGHSRSLLEFLAYFTLFGVSGSLLIPSSSAAVVDLAGSESFGEAMGLYSTAVSLGVALGPILGGVIADLASLEAIFCLAALTCLAGSIIVLAFFKEATVNLKA